MKLRFTIDPQTAEEFVEFFDRRTMEYDGPQDDLTPSQQRSLTEALYAVAPLSVYYDTLTRKISLQ